jgi:hypothetical protein
VAIPIQVFNVARSVFTRSSPSLYAFLDMSENSALLAFNSLREFFPLLNNLQLKIIGCFFSRISVKAVKATYAVAYFPLIPSRINKEDIFHVFLLNSLPNYDLLFMNL